MNIRIPLIALALGSTLALGFTSANAQSATTDGWQFLGDTLIYVGQAAGAGKTRAQVQVELAESRAARVSHDGYAEIGGDTSIYLGSKGYGKSRAEVRAELAAWIQDPRSHDGYREIGGDTLRYVGTNRAAPDLKLAVGDAVR